MKRRSEIPEESKLKRMKVVDLKEWCGACAVGVSGTKDILIGRLNGVRAPVAAKGHLSSSGTVQRPPSHGSPQKKTPSKVQSHADLKRKAINDLCEKYCAETETPNIEMGGFLRFGLDLAGGSEEKSGTPQHTFFLFVISWKMKSAQFGEIKKEDFRTGMEAMGCSSVEDLIESQPRLVAQATKKTSVPLPYGRAAEETDAFRTLYAFVFELLKPEGKKYVEKDMACLALQAFFQGVPGRTSPHVEGFLEFLQSSDAILSLNLDQWKSFMQFSRDVDAGFSGFSDEDPWPSLFDEFVTWSKNQQSWKDKFPENKDA
mmetsp:Transcript_55556/g.131926  ORF Transcript_55556/g.131926 Transcript_55556/m.131926 type:complete len:316 (+) Transcript_55556:215-1162(+)|eukprot:CAMPEP_0180124378 /NCGR_PEP_ID=MMETSP0986-20121125/4617_1 /TAXON_ID=697907 /ORGANISM="non described non described, Strain CCMP2293" /LENGTH=315 /DNA_ID=CAMNT_0022063709 /DNA_START=215 /DNA_END=1162 /DNA_ORIENTATION=-